MTDSRSPAVPAVLATLRELRRSLARGSLPPADQRTPDEHVLNGIFRALEELLCLVDQYRRHVSAGERCRLVEREHVREDGRMLIELQIEVRP